MKKYLPQALVFILATSIALYNIGNFPKMIGDEGIYVSQAYWLTHFGALGPYIYWYDHFPLGWAQIGLWQWLTGPTSFFGYSVLSARIFIGIVLGGTTTLLYSLTHKLTDSKIMSLVSAFIFITSALTLTFGRMVLLDNLSIFWLLLSILILINNPKKISNLAISGLTLGISILTKESLVFFLPPYLALSFFLNRDNTHRKYAILVNYVTVFFLLSFFPLLAILKNELIPQPDRVSLLGTLFFQISRGSGIPFWNPESHFRLMLTTWTKIDPLLLILGAGSTVLSIILPLPTMQKIIASFAIFFLVFLLRGGQIYEFYFIPLIPLLVINLILILNYFNRLTRSHYLTLITLTSIIGYLLMGNLYPFYSTATETQTQSIDVLKSLPANSTIVSNNYTYLDLYLQGKNKIEWYQKAESDPSVRQSMGKITHILTDFQFDDELTGHELPYLESILKTQKPNTKFGVLPAPGQNIKPYINEFLSLYTLQASSPRVTMLTVLSDINEQSLTSLVDQSPYGILISHANFTSSQDLQTKINLIKQILPGTQVITTQDSEGNNNIPWINTNSRSFFKSPTEAANATNTKAVAMKSLGFTGLIVASSHDQDGYLQAIIEAINSSLTPYIRYTGNIPALTANIVVESDTELETLKNSQYPGNIFLITRQ